MCKNWNQFSTLVRGDFTGTRQPPASLEERRRAVEEVGARRRKRRRSG